MELEARLHSPHSVFSFFLHLVYFLKLFTFPRLYRGVGMEGDMTYTKGLL